MPNPTIDKFQIGNTTYDFIDSTARNTADAAVPQTRKVNNKALSADVTLTSDDIGYDSTETYSSGTIGNELTQLSTAINEKLPFNYATTESGTIETEIDFSIKGKGIGVNGSLFNDDNYDTTDYIDLTDVTGIYRTGSTVKFNLWRYVYYDVNKDIISVEGGTTNYEIVEHNGIQVTWLVFNSSAKYVRISKEVSRPFTYYMVKTTEIVTGYDVKYLTFDGEDLFASLSGLKSTNILNPEDFKANGYYLDFTDGTTHVSNANYKMTADMIEINQDYIYVIQTFSTTATNNFVVYCYNSDEEYLGYKIGAFNNLGEKFKVDLFVGTKYIRIFSNAGALISGDMICITLKKVPEFVEYEPVLKIKESALPDPKFLPLYGKMIANFGDSIFGNKRPPTDISSSLSSITGAIVYNLGFGGCRMSQHASGWDAFSMYQLANAIATKDFSVQDAVDVDNVPGMPQYFKETRTLLESIDFNMIDIITISYGTNDFTAGIELDNENDPDDTTTFCGALRYSLEKIMQAYPQIHVFVCTPTYRFWLDGNNDFLYDSNTHEIDGQKLTDFVSAVVDVSKEYTVKSIDNYYELGINKFNRTNWFPVNDGTHHNRNGGMLIAQHMAIEMF